MKLHEITDYYLNTLDPEMEYFFRPELKEKKAERRDLLTLGGFNLDRYELINLMHVFKSFLEENKETTLNKALKAFDQAFVACHASNSIPYELSCLIDRAKRVFFESVKQHGLTHATKSYCFADFDVKQLDEEFKNLFVEYLLILWIAENTPKGYTNRDAIIPFKILFNHQREEDKKKTTETVLKIAFTLEYLNVTINSFY